MLRLIPSSLSTTTMLSQFSPSSSCTREETKRALKNPHKQGSWLAIKLPPSEAHHTTPNPCRRIFQSVFYCLHHKWPAWDLRILEIFQFERQQPKLRQTNEKIIIIAKIANVWNEHLWPLIVVSGFNYIHTQKIQWAITCHQVHLDL